MTVALLYALPVAAWMRVRGMQWRPTPEMAVATGASVIDLASRQLIGGPWATATTPSSPVTPRPRPSPPEAGHGQMG